MGRSHRGRGRLRKLVTLVSLSLLAAALVKELRTPKDQREWEGRIAGIPYDLHPPTPARLKAAYWNRDDPRLFPPRPAGVGWAVNFGRLKANLT